MIKEYNYSIAVEWRFQGDVVPLDPAKIKSVIIDRDFEKTNMPIIFLELAITKKMLDSFIVNKSNATIRLTIQKFDMATEFRQSYISSEFVYFMTDDVNYNASLDYNTDNKDVDTLYVNAVLGLMHLDLINKNKTSINTVYRGTSSMDILAYNLRSTPLVIEQVKSKVWDQIVIPPLGSLSELVAYMNYRNVLYSSPYRFFMDFDRTYLLSSSGKPINIKGQKINTVMLEVLDPLSNSAKVQGSGTDSKANMHRVIIDANEYKVYKDNIADKSFTKITGISAGGYSKTVSVDSGKNVSYSNKTRYVRVPGENLDLVENMKYKAEISSTLVSITKSNMDNSMITLEKVFILKNYKQNAYLDGQYLLARKREIYIKTHNQFNCETVLDFRKLN